MSSRFGLRGGTDLLHLAQIPLLSLTLATARRVQTAPRQLSYRSLSSSAPAAPRAPPMPPMQLANTHDYASFLDKHDTFLFDLDGVVWGGPRGDQL
mgnify:CR=1 FL=1